MHVIDLLSGAPKTLIFQQDSNKSNLGGILTIIYLIIVILIIISYIINYIKSDNYIIAYTSHYESNSDSEFIYKRYDNENLNPKINVTFQIVDIYGQEINENNYGIMYGYTIEDIKFYKLNEEIQTTSYGFNFYLYYKCENVTDDNCIINPEDLFNTNIFYLTINYSGFKLEHQNKKSPITRQYKTIRIPFNIDDNTFSYYYMKWKTIIYSEENSITGIFDNIFGNKKDDKYGGEYLDPIIMVFNEKDYEFTISQKKRGRKIISYILVNSGDCNSYYDLYSRKEKNIFDSIADVFSLSSTIYNILIFIYCGFYSNNFDNYTIIERLLLKAKQEKDNTIIYKINNKITENYEDNSNNENGKEESDRENVFIKNNSNKIKVSTFKNKNDIVVKNSTVQNKILIKEQNKNEIDNKKIILPKLHFLDYFYNNCYKKKCCFSRNQELITICNEIAKQYNSIDLIIYNQLILENLFKDYKWNDPKLNTILNNKLIQDLNLNKN